MSVQFPSSFKGAFDTVSNYLFPPEPSYPERMITFFNSLFPKTEPKTFREQASDLSQQAWNIASNKFAQAEKGFFGAVDQGQAFGKETWDSTTNLLGNAEKSFFSAVDQAKVFGKETWDSTTNLLGDAEKGFFSAVDQGQAKAGIIYNQILVPKAQEAYGQASQFIANNSQEVAAGAAVIGGFALVKGAQDLSEGKKKQGFAEMAAGILGIGSAGYIQSDTIIKPVMNTITPYLMQAKEWVDDKMATTPQLATVTGLIGGGTLALGVNDLMNGNKKRGTVETIMGLAGISLSIYGLYGDKTCPAPTTTTTPATAPANTCPNSTFAFEV